MADTDAAEAGQEACLRVAFVKGLVSVLHAIKPASAKQVGRRRDSLRSHRRRQPTTW